MGSAVKKSDQLSGFSGTGGAIREAILFVSRANIRPLLKQELKVCGVETVHNSEELTTCIDLLNANGSALLVIDADHDRKLLSTVLKAAQGPFNVDTRPIFLIAQAVSPDIISFASEYNISRIHSGEISRSAIHSVVKKLIAEEEDDASIRNTMIRVADARIRNDWDSSEVLLLDLFTRFPLDARIACELAENYINKNDWQQAQAIIESIQDPTQGNLRVMHMKARCLMRHSKFSDAEALLQQCKLVNPYNIDRLIDLGISLMNMARVQEALENFELALSLDANRREAVDGKVQCKLLSGDVNEALILMRQITSPRELAALFNNAAILAIRHGKFGEGVILYKTALGTVGNNEAAAARLCFNLGLAHMKFGNQHDALSCFEKAADIDKEFYNTRYNANVVALKLGMKPPFPALKARIQDITDQNEEESLS